MRDEMNHNALAITGTPTLVSGGLTVDTDQALQFNGTTNSGSVTDSTSLSITGNLSIEFFLRFPSAPGSTQGSDREGLELRRAAEHLPQAPVPVSTTAARTSR